MKYYVIYKKYIEWNQFEGRWMSEWQEFNNKKEVIEWMKNIKSDNNYDDIIGPLVKL